MKRAKDDEKITGPMFPRLHVNDTDKGGPRPPPRNKMALYEQLSIPSQRFSAGGLPHSRSNTSNLVPPASSGQRTGNERNMFFPHQLSPRYQAEKPYDKYSDISIPSEQVEQRKKLDDDDFRVPIFINSRKIQDSSKYYSFGNRVELSLLNPASSSQSMKLQNGAERDLTSTGVIEHSRRQEGQSHNKENPEELVSVHGHLAKAASASPSKNMPECLRTGSLHHGEGDDPVNVNNQKEQTDHNINRELTAESQPGDNVHGNAVLRNTSVGMRNFLLEEQNLVHDLTNDTESHEDGIFRPQQMGNVDRGDDVSETSIVDSVSGSDISPDDVVAIIGQKRFWKARRAIVNQQRVFAVQLFELHRLIKVQRLIAGSPHLMHEDNAYLGKTVKSATKKLPLDYVVRASSVVTKNKNEPEKPNHRMECSAENAVARTSASSVANDIQPSNSRPFSGILQTPAVSSEQSIGQWCFNQPSGHQWLIPVMSPLEGLVYKPYPGPGFMGPVCGGCGPPGSIPLMGNYLSPMYGIPTPPHQFQGVGLPSFPRASPHGYFPGPYGMANMNSAFSGSSVEQMNHLPSSGQLSAGGANFSIPHQDSSNLPSQKNVSGQDVRKLHVPEESGIQGSTASSPRERPQGSGAGSAIKGRNMLPLFPTSPTVNIPDGGRRATPEPDQPPRVIKVVPHSNARSATESAARIFQSIQEGRNS